MAGTDGHPSARQFEKTLWEQLPSEGSQGADGYFNIRKRPNLIKVTSEWRRNKWGMTSGKTKDKHLSKYRTEGMDLSNGDNVLWGVGCASEKIVSIEKP